jgi:hypothetical protein
LKAKYRSPDRGIDWRKGGNSIDRLKEIGVKIDSSSINILPRSAAYRSASCSVPNADIKLSKVWLTVTPLEYRVSLNHGFQWVQFSKSRASASIKHEPRSSRIMVTAIVIPK